MRVVKNISNHRFKIGTIVRKLTAMDLGVKAILCEDDKGKQFWLLEEELEKV